MGRPDAPKFYPPGGFTKGRRPANVSTGMSYRDVVVKDSVPRYAPRKSVEIDCEVQLYPKHVMGEQSTNCSSTRKASEEPNGVWEEVEECEIVVAEVFGGLPEIIPKHNEQGLLRNEKAEVEQCQLVGDAAGNLADSELIYEVEETVRVGACIGIDLQESRVQVRSLIQGDGVCNVPQ
ncbi:hypothetical protein L1987_61570 [Smallanthus sonchifolius]|uniref:Uncharacterized protein n=1 Tax=Smallanthus sonchifolius TaxID=185202 RepID=A0ACB9C866_9ASTR|nr:hypothetical protein L1987_61570 [Smallanthus sonchifolius]